MKLGTPTHSFPLRLGYSCRTEVPPNVQHRPDFLFLPVDPTGTTTYSKFIRKNNLFKTSDAPILKFFAYYDDRGELPRDRMKFRKCYIQYYVEDGTIKVYEPQQKNAGYPQGPLIGRNIIPKPEGGYYTLDDLNIGETLNMFGKTFKLLDCDGFTRMFLREMGYRLGTPEKEVDDPVYADRQEQDTHRTMLHRPHEKDKSGQIFLKNFPKVLHFKATYHRKPVHQEDIRYVSLYYDLTDGKIKITDDGKFQEYKYQLMNGNFDNFLILRPIHVPKNPKRLGLIGENSGKTILNLAATTKTRRLEELMVTQQNLNLHFKDHFLLDSNPVKVKEDSEEYYTAQDLDLGKTIEVFGADVFLYDCDDFTKEYYKKEFNKEMIPVPLGDVKCFRYHKIIVPAIFGRKEDNLVTCQRLYSVKGMKRFLDLYALSSKISRHGSLSGDLLKYYLNCSTGCNSKQLRFLSQVVTDDPKKKYQCFIIRWFLDDDTIEIKGLNLNFTISGVPEANFLHRMKLQKPSLEDTPEGNCYYSLVDLYVGNVIYAIRDPFLLIDADEYSYDYMERHCDTFMHSNINDILNQLKGDLEGKGVELHKAFIAADVQNKGLIEYRDFRTIIYNHISEAVLLRFPEQRMKTLARFYAIEEYVGLKLDELASKIQTELKRARFQDFEKLRQQFLIFNEVEENKDEYFTPSDVYDILRSFPLPVNRDLLKGFIFKMPTRDNLIKFTDILETLNYIENPAKPADLTPYAVNINWERIEKRKNIDKIPYLCFLQNLTSDKCPNSIVKS